MLINGPVNVVRLEGKINNINKIIWVFFDKHINLRLQTECESYDSQDIVRYLYNLFKNTNKVIDFFLEIKKSHEKSYHNYPFKNIYILDLAKFYSKSITSDTESKEIKKEIKNKKNIRFHYLDIRDYLEKNVYDYIDLLMNSIDNLPSKKDIFSSDFTNIVDSCIKLVYELEIYKEFFENPDKNDLLKQNVSDDKKNILYYLNKITFKYKDESIIGKIKKTYFPDILKNINLAISKLKELTKIIMEKEQYIFRDYDYKVKIKNNNYNLDEHYGYGDYNTRMKFIYNCDDLAYSIDILLLKIFCKITDLFFLRRFLDKDYITNAITYTGFAHSVNYINILVSIFDFKITHFSYSDEKNIEKVNEIAKNDYDKLLYILSPPRLIQCSDISNFPNDF